MGLFSINKTWARDIVKKFTHRFVPSWYIFAFDVLVVFGSYFIAYALRVNFNLAQLEVSNISAHAVIITYIYSISFIVFRSYSGIIRHTGFTDTLKILQANGAAFVIILLISLGFRFTNSAFAKEISFGVLAIHFLLAYFVMMGARIVVKTTYHVIAGSYKRDNKTVLIYGAGASGLLTLNALFQDIYISYNVAAFIDENHGKIGKTLERINILSPKQALNPEYIRRFDVDQLIISIQNITKDKQRTIVEEALELNLEVKIVPAIDKWINGQLSSEQIRKVNIEELLQREPIKMDSSNVSRYIYGKSVLITGAAGSIGSGLVRQVLTYRPAKLILLDQAESAIYDLQTEINNSDELVSVSHLAEYIIANVKDKFRINQIFERYKPDIVFHAAAYKHVPLMENNPYEALLVNVFGTRTLADLAVKHRVEKFVMISTDKAVNPTNVMGASKRIAEIYTQSLNDGITQFITTRFGNVLGSNGSVVPLFRKQIENGGPVTVTHKEITRFFMTIPEACSLVLEAGAMGKGGEIFVFDMGHPVKIYDLARKMIKLSGLEIDKDIEIKEIGLRSGEKLYEELLNNQENTLPTYHPKILKAKVRTYKKEFIETSFDDLAHLIIDANVFELVAKMKQIVPEYVSNNSIYDVLDKQRVSK
ncbi:MAG: nucleoside-diphosphate sugar epimerase/dehydratase [Bacteroidales bacterium]|nr:nucleoside-diphosphate sugar epimerase/dehydratase [Bacteroidales bacterium]MDD4672247.1 nucleoside-diphosphate sugar epimerase/dehydratase [Bacteroidales bacterium]